MAGKVFELKGLLEREGLAQEISNMWDSYNSQRKTWLDEKKELREYLFATDTTKTSNSRLPWKNKTTLPKLTQIRDNLYANYMSALFPNDKWLKWEGYNQDSDTLLKKRVITTYMHNKLRQNGFREVIGQLLLDYIDYGNCFADVEFVAEYKEDKKGNKTPNYIGAKAIRISPLDIVFNPLAVDFNSSPKITRYIKTIGEIKKELKSYGDKEHFEEILKIMGKKRVASRSGYSQSDWVKAGGYLVDGFGSLQDYYQSNYVEILEFEGDIHDADGTLLENYIITVIDRQHIVRKEVNPSWISGSLKVKGGWRKRPDTLWAMGALDNLVGMQYRIDHLENLKADAMDLAVHPPMVIAGNVDEFNYAPGSEIYLGEGGVVTELGRNLNGVIAANNEINVLEAKMELYAGAPRETMGVRSPGEKTAFEVQQLLTAAGRIFQEKLTAFEVEVLEPLLNRMLEVTIRNLNTADVIRVMDDDFGIVEFMTITKEDITAEGKLYPMGARHFTAQSMLIQNLNGVFNSGMSQFIAPHVKSMSFASMIEDVMGFDKYAIFQENAQIYEALERQKLQMVAQEELAVAQQAEGMSG